MKFVVVFTLILASQASASILDGFSSAFVSVENSFGKLLNDVVSDVKVTIDCTISAVENALSIGGLFNEHSEYEKRCKGETTNNKPVDIKKPVYVAPKTNYDSVPPQPISEKQSFKRETPSSKPTVDETIRSIIAKPKLSEGLEPIKTVLKQDTAKLDNVGSSLTKQLDNITSNVKNEVEQIDAGSASTVNEMLNEINNLHKVTDQKSEAENSQIRSAYDEVMDAIHSNSTTVHLANNTSAKEIMNDLEKTSNNTFTNITTTYSQFKDSENKHLDDLKDIVESKSKDLVKSQSNETSTEKPKSFKTLAQKIMSETSNTIEKATETTVQNVTEAPIPSTEKPPDDKSEPTEDSEVLMFNTYFGSNSQDAQDDSNDVMSLIQQSSFSQMLMDKVSSSDDAVSVFDHPELLNYR